MSYREKTEKFESFQWDLSDLINKKSSKNQPSIERRLIQEQKNFVKIQKKLENILSNEVKTTLKPRIYFPLTTINLFTSTIN